MTKRKYLTVTALTNYLKSKLDRDQHLQDVFITGEISNFYHHVSGHMYLSLKDDNTVIPAAFFSGYNQQLKFRPENGMNVYIRGQVTVYPAQGRYQLYIHDMQPDGHGALFLAYEQLKEKLAKAGYFNPEHKKPIAPYPKSIGLITSRSSAAVRDMITTIKRRYPIVQITVIHAAVQGEDAVPSIVKAIKRANHIGGFDTLIVGRGGGSIEDLWAFNEEAVIEAVFASEIPIIAAVGHETDTTLSELVADLRAATPTAAAELAVPSLVELTESVFQRQNRLQQLMNLLLSERKRQVQQLQDARAFQSPKNIIYEKQQYIDHLYDKMNYQTKIYLREKKHQVESLHYKLKSENPLERLVRQREKLTNLTRQLNRLCREQKNQKQRSLMNTIDKLSLVNPLHILQRGFALPLDENNQLVKSIEDVELKEAITLEVSDGSIQCIVNDKRGKTRVERK